ncbi:3-hydroxyacyl-ACP dehydratase FabZ family protein [Serratia sp. AKBS12]|uniref:3-hydroxyacyl-ACP dehydratase FabZ family protein n=1 Tax=Serratia sp. AKBS12 TaxID=2974597 RepID=UPI002164F3BA|nr:hydroxymyristoyl-ACP dehydratase [Serratia sp. AKBS12]MCS3409956.1 hydroxymyristoyl-ACP dehydratase [Serratia sp. AKBS12]HEI8867236.1 hydroxymyristoyl-ACP dehydratase [Serratia odorifera]
MMQPEVLQRQMIDATHACVQLCLPSELLWFRGHFPQHPILPGVAQVNWAMQFARELLLPEAGFGGIEVLKFQRPLMPQETVTLALEWQPERNKLLFSYRVAAATASSGKIALCR